jgi:hypothetical protein
MLASLARSAYNSKAVGYLQPLYSRLRTLGAEGVNVFLDRVGDISAAAQLGYPPLAGVQALPFRPTVAPAVE